MAIYLFRRKHWKYITYSVPIEEDVKRIGKKWKEITKTLPYKLKIMVTARFIKSSLSNLVNNFAEEIHKIKCKYWHDNKEGETCGIK